MSESPAAIHSETAGGVAAYHDPLPLPQALIAPTISGKEFNTIRLSVAPFACWRAHDMRFAFDSSFVLPTIAAEMKALKSLIDKHALKDDASQTRCTPVLSVFGHADPVGSDDYNKALSGRRALAIYALVTRRSDMWEDLYSQTGIFVIPSAGDVWGTRSIQIMLNSILPHDSGTERLVVDGTMGSKTQAAVKQFQSANGLAADGDPGAQTRKRLFLAYMDEICLQDGDQPYQLGADQFLGGGQDRGGKADYQGCSEFNPVLLFSQTEIRELSDPQQKEARDAKNAPNRRVLIFLFRPGVQVHPNSWPCPRANEGVTGCQKRFWSNGEKRRSTRLPDQERKYEETKDTFACRFYDRLANKSPCERSGATFYLRIRLRDAEGQIRTGLAYSLTVAGSTVSHKTDEQGMIEQKVPASATTATLTVDGQDIQLKLQPLPEVTKPDGAQQRLKNMAYYDGAVDGQMTDATKDAILYFQMDINEDDPSITPTGQLDLPTCQALAKIHGR